MYCFNTYMLEIYYHRYKKYAENINVKVLRSLNDRALLPTHFAVCINEKNWNY